MFLELRKPVKLKTQCRSRSCKEKHESEAQLFSILNTIEGKRNFGAAIRQLKNCHEEENPANLEV